MCPSKWDALKGEPGSQERGIRRSDDGRYGAELNDGKSQPRDFLKKQHM